MKTLDACGFSCPEPLLMLKNALKTENKIMLLLDSKNALDNCESYAKKLGFSVSTTTENKIFKLYIKAAK